MYLRKVNILDSKVKWRNTNDDTTSTAYMEMTYELTLVEQKPLFGSKRVENKKGQQ